MRKTIPRLAGAAVAAIVLAACASAGAEKPSIAIPYDPAGANAAELQARAQDYCDGYGKRAVYVDETIDPNNQRLRHRRFDCV